MASMNELDLFRTFWEREAQLTIQLLESLPRDQYDFRPDPGGRSLGELAWHLSEIEGYISYGITKGAVTFQEAPPNLQRPGRCGSWPRDTGGYTTRRWRGSPTCPRRSSNGSCRSPTSGCLSASCCGVRC